MDKDTPMLDEHETRLSTEQQDVLSLPKENAGQTNTAKRTLEDAGLNEENVKLSRSQKRARNNAAKKEGQANATPKGSSGGNQSASKKGCDKFDLEEKWVDVTINGKASHRWDPIAYPPPGPDPKEPPECTIRYSISPEPGPNFQVALRRRLKSYVTGGFPVPGKPVSFLEQHSGSQQYPDIALLMYHGRRAVDICYATRAQAAYAGQMEEFSVPFDERSIPKYTLYKLKAGPCHSRDLISIEVTPEVESGVSPSSVPASAYQAAVEQLLEQYPMLTCMGAWRSSVQWDANTTQLRPVMLLVVRREPEFQPHNLPGFIRSISDKKEDTDDVAGFWFHLQHGWRRRFCRNCKTLVHEPRNCPQNHCDKCFLKGHTSANCRYRESRADGPEIDDWY